MSDDQVTSDDARPMGFGLFGKDASGVEELLDWWETREMLERIIPLGLYQSQGYTDLVIRESDGEGTNSLESLRQAETNAAFGRPIKKRLRTEAARRAAAMPDTRFVMWREIWSAIDAAGVLDGEPVASIHCEFPVDLAGEPELKIDRDKFGIVRISFGAKCQ